MSIISMSATIAALVTRWDPGQLRHDTTERSDSTGAEAARLLAPPQHAVSVQWGDNMTLAQAGAVKAFLLQLRGKVNAAALYDPIRTTPEGGVTGTLKLVGDLPAGSTSMVLTGATNALGFDAGDVFQIGTGVGTSHYGTVIADADPAGSGTFTWTSFTWTSFTWTDTGNLTVTFEPPTRTAFVAGTVVTIDKPLFYARMQGDLKGAYSTQARRHEGGFAADFAETFSP